MYASIMIQLYLTHDGSRCHDPTTTVAPADRGKLLGPPPHVLGILFTKDHVDQRGAQLARRVERQGPSVRPPPDAQQLGPVREVEAVDPDGEDDVRDADTVYVEKAVSETQSERAGSRRMGYVADWFPA